MKTSLLKLTIAMLACLSFSVAQAKDKKQTDFEALQAKVKEHIAAFVIGRRLCSW